MKAQYHVVAKNRMEAFYHPSIPRLGEIKGGKRVVGLTGGPVPSFPKWWLIHVQRESLRIGWRLINLRRKAK
jgi:hypothetical protein